MSSSTFEFIYVREHLATYSDLETSFEDNSFYKNYSFDHGSLQVVNTDVSPHDSNRSTYLHAVTSTNMLIDFVNKDQVYLFDELFAYEFVGKKGVLFVGSVDGKFLALNLILTLFLAARCNAMKIKSDFTIVYRDASDLTATS